MKPATKLHDQVLEAAALWERPYLANVVCLPILGTLAIGGILGWCDPVRVTTVAFMVYILGDFCWVAAIPDAVPSLPSLILFHHAVTLAMLCIPLRHPELGPFTCWDGLVEINTLFLILRRQFKTGRMISSFFYWATFFPLRFVLYPALLWQFYTIMQPYALWEQALVCSCQSILISFNVVFLRLSIANWRGSRQQKLQNGRAHTLSSRSQAAAASKPGHNGATVRLQAKQA